MKSIKSLSQRQFKDAFPGLKGVDFFAKDFPIDPFLVMTEYHMSKPVFGPHPHAGISVMTYMLPDSKQGFINRDSNGDFSIIKPGGLHITQAGLGIHHDEFPIKEGIDTHGFQIWINHKEEDRMVEPKAIHAEPLELPVYKSEGMELKVLHGSYENLTPQFSMVTSLNLYHVILAMNQSLSLSSSDMTFVYGINGEASSANRSLKSQALAIYEEGEGEVSINTADLPFEFLYASAQPINEPIVYGGPFVSTTPQQMQDFRLRLGSGKMGFLEPYQQN